MVLSKIKEIFKKKEEEKKEEEGYIEIKPSEVVKLGKAKIQVRVFVLNEFSDVKKILDAIREGYTICFVDIRPLKEKDYVELKRAIAKIKKTVEAIDGDIAGVGGEWIIVTPPFAEIYRPKGQSEIKEIKS